MTDTALKEPAAAHPEITGAADAPAPIVLHGPVILRPQPGETVVVLLGSEMEPEPFDALVRMLHTAMPHQTITVVTDVRAVSITPAGQIVEPAHA